MPVKHSAGVVVFRRNRGGNIEVFLVHPGGPYWTNKERAAWSIPKGLVEDNEDPASAAQREFSEETGFSIAGPVHDLGTFRQPGGKLLSVWACEAEPDPNQIRSNTFSLEWPPHSGKLQQFPEVDRAAWFSISDAAEKIHGGQKPILARLGAMLAKES